MQVTKRQQKTIVVDSANSFFRPKHILNSWVVLLRDIDLIVPSRRPSPSLNETAYPLFSRLTSTKWLNIPSGAQNGGCDPRDSFYVAVGDLSQNYSGVKTLALARLTGNKRL